MKVLIDKKGEIRETQSNIIREFSVENNHKLIIDINPKNSKVLKEKIQFIKDSFGCNIIYYQGIAKVASVLAFGISPICIHQSLKLVS